MDGRAFVCKIGRVRSWLIDRLALVDVRASEDDLEIGQDVDEDRHGQRELRRWSERTRDGEAVSGVVQGGNRSRRVEVQPAPAVDVRVVLPCHRDGV